MKINTKSESTIVESIDYLAKDLILNRAIKVNESIFSIIDVEVYFWHEKHKDEYARGVDHFKPFGEFEAHRYGIDLFLGNKAEIEFGGVLICGLIDTQSQIVIEKSSVIRTIFNQLNIGGNSISIISHSNIANSLFRTKRLNLGKSDNDKKKFVDAKYKYLLKDCQIFKKYKDKERIFKESDLSEAEIQDLLGYKIKK